MVNVFEGVKVGADGTKLEGLEEGFIDGVRNTTVVGSFEGKSVGMVDGNPVRRILGSCEGKNVCAVEGNDDS